jgi:hypothetical protein
VGEYLVGTFEVVDSKSHLLHVVSALHSTSGFTSGLNGRQEQSNQNPDDCDNHEQFHKRETTPNHHFLHSNNLKIVFRTARRFYTQQQNHFVLNPLGNELGVV